MNRGLLRAALLVAVWIVLWRDLSWANVISGTVLAIVVTSVFTFTEQRMSKTLRPLPLLRYLATFTWSVVKANLVVAWEVVTPKNRIREGVVAVELTTDDPVLIAIISHSIGLAPGTMVIDIEREPTVLYVHSLHLRSVEDEQAEVRRLERLLLEAFDPGTTVGRRAGGST